MIGILYDLNFFKILKSFINDKFSLNTGKKENCLFLFFYQIDYLYNIANAYMELDDMFNAKEALTKYILLGKVDSDILFTLANIESELDDYKNSILHYQMAINIGRPTVNMFYNLAMSYAEIDDFMQALNAFKSAYELDPNDFEIISTF